MAELTDEEPDLWEPEEAPEENDPAPARLVADRASMDPHDFAWQCSDMSPEVDGMAAFGCTRPRGHAGRHVGEAGPGYVCAAWPGTHPLTLEDLGGPHG